MDKQHRRSRAKKNHIFKIAWQRHCVEPDRVGPRTAGIKGRGRAMRRDPVECALAASERAAVVSGVVAVTGRVVGVRGEVIVSDQNCFQVHPPAQAPTLPTKTKLREIVSCSKRREK